VLNVSKISDRNRARSKNHVQERNIFVFCSPVRAIAILLPDGTVGSSRTSRSVESRLPENWWDMLSKL
jgi:hypothetical protein